MNPIPGNGDGVVTTSKSGVALIMVIGLVALMMVMAVAFAIYMRTERVAAGAFRNDVRARQLLHVAQARALDGLEANLGDRPYPNWDILSSSGGGGEVANFTNSPVLDWIPRAMLASGINPRPQWIQVSGGSEQGRVGYMIVNCSGLLDANASGDGVTRGVGTNVAEIQVGNLPEMSDINGFIASRPYETVQELNGFAGAANYVVRPVTNFVDFSYFPKPARVFVGGQSNQWDSQAQVIQAFRDSGLGSDPIWGDFANNAYMNLLDYVDSDSIPQRLDAGCVEAVPMINEVDLTYQFTLNPDRTWTAYLIFQVEYAYPFVNSSTLSFNLNAGVSFSNLNGNVSASFIPPAQNGITQPLGAIQSYGMIDVPASDISLSGGPLPAGPVRVHFQCALNLKMMTGGVACDAVPAGAAAPLLFDIDLSPVSDGQPVVVTKWIECIDPRFNWDPDDLAQWVPSDAILSVIPSAAPTPNDINEVTKLSLYPANYGQTASEDYDGDFFMHVANAPLRTAGELGSICYAPLRTIRLYSHSGAPNTENAPFHKVLDNFSVTTNAPTHGFVNLNTRSIEVLAAILAGAPTRDFDAKVANWAPIAWDVAQTLASKIVNQGCYTNLSDLGLIDWRAYSSVPGNELVSESYIRNTSGLLSCRQNLFIIFTYAQATRQVPNLGVSTVSGCRGIAEVWRDPVQNDQGSHPRFVRLFRFLGSD
ncbi:MAG: hypothetical protein WCO77_11005 [bacterium]